MKKAFSVSGRANRKEFAIIQFVCFFLNIILFIPLYWSFRYNTSFLVFFNLMLFIATTALIIRRLHDFNISGWSYFFFNFFLMVITFYLIIKDGSIKKEVQMSTETLIFSSLATVLQYLALFFIKGTPGPNKYGEPPIN